jgi:hypothetical protein
MDKEQREFLMAILDRLDRTAVAAERTARAMEATLALNAELNRKLTGNTKVSAQ